MTNWRRQGTGIPFFPQILPPGTVVGRLQTNAGPTEAIPIATLAALFNANSNVQIVADSGPIVCADDTQILIINKLAASATPVTLPSVLVRNKVGLEIYDWTGMGGDITLTPAFGEMIMGGLNPWAIASGGAAQSGGSLKLTPLVDLLGWLVR